MSVTAGAVFCIADESAIASRRVPLGQLPVLSRLISLLSRIPAVKWAFTRLRPSSQGDRVDRAAIAASGSPHIVPEIAEAAPDASTDIAVATAVAGDNSMISAVAESPAAAPTDISLADDPSMETPTEVESVVVEEVSISPVVEQNEAVGTPELMDGAPPAELLAKVESVIFEEAPASSVEVESEPIDIFEPVVESSPELPANTEPVVAEEAPVSVEAEVAPADAPVLVVTDDLSSGLVVDVEPAVVDSSCVDSEVAAKNVSESKVDNAPSLGVAAEIEPIPANDPAPIAVVAAEAPSADAPNPATDSAPEPVLASPAPKLPAAPKPRARVVEPTDRAALIRQRWAETGVRMWNPRLHGIGEATLNIQGSIGLLPPSPGETMPRYDKLEFKMLGGQIVCEGVIVEAPAQAGHRNFTRLAEPAKPDRAREPARERQAALA